jgi:hypothetical protein
MSADSSLDPYRSPTLPEGPYIGAPTTRRPGWLTALCVVCIVLGALGILNSLVGTAAVLAGPKFQAMFQPRPTQGMPDDMLQAQQDLMDEINAVQKRHFLTTLLLLAFKFIVAVLLLAGGLRCLGLNEGGRKLLLIACAVALLFEVVHSILQSIVNLEMMTATNSAVEKFESTVTTGNTPPGTASIMKWTIRGAFIVPIITSYFMSLLKSGLFVFGLVYLNKKHIKSLFSR